MLSSKRLQNHQFSQKSLPVFQHHHHDDDPSRDHNDDRRADHDCLEHLQQRVLELSPADDNGAVPNRIIFRMIVPHDRFLFLVQNRVRVLLIAGRRRVLTRNVATRRRPIGPFVTGLASMLKRKRIPAISSGPFSRTRFAYPGQIQGDVVGFRGALVFHQVLLFLFALRDRQRRTLLVADLAGRCDVEFLVLIPR